MKFQMFIAYASLELKEFSVKSPFNSFINKKIMLQESNVEILNIGTCMK